jgi:hypothetical protein
VTDGAQPRQAVDFDGMEFDFGLRQYHDRLPELNNLIGSDTVSESTVLGPISFSLRSSETYVTGRPHAAAATTTIGNSSWGLAGASDRPTAARAAAAARQVTQILGQHLHFRGLFSLSRHVRSGFLALAAFRFRVGGYADPTRTRPGRALNSILVTVRST